MQYDFMGKTEPKQFQILLYVHAPLQHCSDVAQVSLRLKSLTNRLFVQQIIQVHNKYWNSRGTTNDQWIPVTNDQ